MNRQDWRKRLGDVVRDAMRSPELEHYFTVKITKPGAQVLITQLGLFIHHRRDCWAHVSGNCPHMSVKQKILQHEYGEVIKDKYAEHGHMELIVRQGTALGMRGEQGVGERRPFAERRRRRTVEPHGEALDGRSRLRLGTDAEFQGPQRGG